MDLGASSLAGNVAGNAVAIALNTAKEGSKWENDNANGYVKLKNQSDGSTAKTNATNIFLHDSGQVSINTTNKNSDLTVAGSMAFQLRVQTFNSANESYTIQDDDYTVIINQLGSIILGEEGTVNLPSAAAKPGRILKIINRSILSLGLNLFGSEKVVGGLVGSIAPLAEIDVTAVGINSIITIQSSGGKWYVIGTGTVNL